MKHTELKSIRTKLGLSQTAFAMLLKRTRDCVAKWESGKYIIPTKMVQIINEMG